MWYDCVQGASRDVELVSWPQMPAGAVHGEGAADNAGVQPRTAALCLQARWESACPLVQKEAAPA